MTESALAIIADRVTPHGVTIEVSGDIDVRGAASLTEILERSATAQDGAVMVDLVGVRSLTIAGLQPVLAAQRRWPGRITVTGASAPARRLFHVLGLALP